MNIISIKPQPIPEQLGIYSQAAVSVSSLLYCDWNYNAKFLGGSSDLSMPELRDVVLVGLILQVRAWSCRCSITQYGSTVYIGMALVWPAL